MTDQEIFDALANLEEALFYRTTNPRALPAEELRQMHDDIDAMLRAWHRLTGCTNE